MPATALTRGAQAWPHQNHLEGSELLIQWVWGEPSEFARLTSPQVMLSLVLQEHTLGTTHAIRFPLDKEPYGSTFP